MEVRSCFSPAPTRNYESCIIKKGILSSLSRASKLNFGPLRISRVPHRSDPPSRIQTNFRSAGDDKTIYSFARKPKMRKPPLAHCTIFLVVKQQLHQSPPSPSAALSVSDKMYFNQKIIVINNRWSARRQRRRRFYTNNECLFFTWSNLMLLFDFFAGAGSEVTDMSARIAVHPTLKI